MGAGGGGGLCVIGDPPESTLIWCRNSTREMDNELFDQLSDLMVCFETESVVSDVTGDGDGIPITTLSG